MTQTIQVANVPVEQTSVYGGDGNNVPAYDIKTSGKPVRWVQACWTGEVIKGLALKFHNDDTLYTVGDWNNSSEHFHRAATEIAVDDPLVSFKVSTASFGRQSIRGIFVQTRSMAKKGDVWWSAGNITDPFSFYEVEARYWMGIFGKVNKDNFINSLGLWVTKKK
jgi:hypothetical protein